MIIKELLVFFSVNTVIVFTDILSNTKIMLFLKKFRLSSLVNIYLTKK